MSESEKEKQLYQDRLKKLESLRAVDIDPYPATAHRSHTVRQATVGFEALEKSQAALTLTGRIRALRGHGKLVFGHLEDESGSLQFALKADELDQSNFKLIGLLDVGDFIEITGRLFVTKKGEQTLLAKKFRVLTKSLRALPEKYHGLKDVEIRLRKRHLDLLISSETRELFRKKSLFWQSIRSYLLAHGFLEVETPVLEHVPGGAEAEPFITHHNALNRDFYLRISLELPLKRLLVGGYEKVFEIGRVFRNEGIDAEHLQDYTSMEFYWAYTDYHDLMKFLQGMYQQVIKQVFGTLQTSFRGQQIDWSGQWPVVDFYDLFRQYVGVESGVSEKEFLRALQRHNLEDEASAIVGKGRLWDFVYKKLVRPKLIQPQFMIRPPVEMEPLAKRDTEFPNRVQRVQIMAAGTELGKGFSELNDPLDQRARFEEQMQLRKQGDKEAQMLDEDFIEALEYGMPPAAGFGVSERLFAVLMDKPVRETVLFPPMKEEK